jgi:long-chain acyl-CoA synthetase
MNTDITRVFDLLQYQKTNFPKEDALANKVNGKWVKYSSQDLINYANYISLGLLNIGIQKGDKIAIISFNRPEWNFVDYGIQQIGAVSVPMYPTITIDDYAFIFKEADVKVVFVSNKELYDKVKAATSTLEQQPKVYTFDALEGIPNWNEIVELGKKDIDLNKIESIKVNIQPNDLLTLIYTSGTTGNPKGVMLSHNNLVSNFKACKPLMPVDHRHRALSFLPLCHIYERMLNYLYMYCGISVYYAESFDTISDNLKEVKPHIFVTVPRLLEKVYDKIYAKGQELKGFKRTLFFWALNLGLRYEVGKNMGLWYNLKLKIADKLIFKKWREALGGNVIAVVSGGAALQPRLGKIFWAAGIPIMQGYGLTETSPVISVNRCDPKLNRIDTVGQPIDGVLVKIAPDGEILTKGPHVMLGYYKRPELTSEVIDSEGWFHTGDIGEISQDGFIKITDRKKEMFKTSGGKYIAPQQLENKLKEIVVVEQAMVVGDGEKFPAALIVPAFAELKKWCEHKGIPYTTDEEMIKHPDVLAKYQKEIDEINENFAQYEKIKKFALLPKPWSIETGELTAKLSLKRKVISEKYKSIIESFYEHNI